MFAGSDIHFGEPLVLDEVARRVSTITAVDHKNGRSGELVLIEMEHVIEQRGEMRVRERQTLVYRADGIPTAKIVPLVVSLPDESDATMWQPGPVDLFRFSAVTFNSHRIHYDDSYATGVEGYPALVVHGPFTAARLYRRAARHGRPTTFGFRAMAPLFVDQPIRLTGSAADGEIVAIRCDGVTAMRATTGF
jgi:3-methylfumaryl-CoA hydratase